MCVDCFPKAHPILAHPTIPMLLGWYLLWNQASAIFSMLRVVRTALPQKMTRHTLFSLKKHDNVIPTTDDHFLMPNSHHLHHYLYCGYQAHHQDDRAASADALKWTKGFMITTMPRQHTTMINIKESFLACVSSTTTTGSNQPISCTM